MLRHNTPPSANFVYIFHSSCVYPTANFPQTNPTSAWRRPAFALISLMTTVKTVIQRCCTLPLFATSLTKD